MASRPSPPERSRPRPRHRPCRSARCVRSLTGRGFSGDRTGLHTGIRSSTGGLRSRRHRGVRPGPGLLGGSPPRSEVAVSKIGVVLHRQKTLGAGPEALRMGLADAGHADPPWSEVPKSSKAPKEVRRLLDTGIDRLLVWGGDGMVRRCIDTLVTEDADVEVAILPAGTANLLAKALSIPDRPRRRSRRRLARHPSADRCRRHQR